MKRVIIATVMVLAVLLGWGASSVGATEDLADKRFNSEYLITKIVPSNTSGGMLYIKSNSVSRGSRSVTIHTFRLPMEVHPDEIARPMDFTRRTDMYVLGGMTMPAMGEEKTLGIGSLPIWEGAAMDFYFGIALGSNSWMIRKISYEACAVAADYQVGVVCKLREQVDKTLYYDAYVDDVWVGGYGESELVGEEVGDDGEESGDGDGGDEGVVDGGDGNAGGDDGGDGNAGGDDGVDGIDGIDGIDGETIEGEGNEEAKVTLIEEKKVEGVKLAKADTADEDLVNESDDAGQNTTNNVVKNTDTEVTVGGDTGGDGEEEVIAAAGGDNNRGDGGEVLGAMTSGAGDEGNNGGGWGWWWLVVLLAGVSTVLWLVLAIWKKKREA